MKTAEVRDKIIALVQWPKKILIPHNRKREIDKELESYVEEHALKFQKHLDELYGIGGFEQDDKIEYTDWIKHQ